MSRAEEIAARWQRQRSVGPAMQQVVEAAVPFVAMPRPQRLVPRTEQDREEGARYGYFTAHGLYRRVAPGEPPQPLDEGRAMKPPRTLRAARIRADAWGQRNPGVPVLVARVQRPRRGQEGRDRMYPLEVRVWQDGRSHVTRFVDPERAPAITDPEERAAILRARAPDAPGNRPYVRPREIAAIAGPAHAFDTDEE